MSQLDDYGWIPPARWRVYCDISFPSIDDVYACRTPEGVEIIHWKERVAVNRMELWQGVPVGFPVLVECIDTPQRNPRILTLVGAWVPSEHKLASDDRLRCIKFVLDMTQTRPAPITFTREVREQFLMGDTVGMYPADARYWDLQDMRWYWFENQERTVVKYDLQIGARLPSTHSVSHRVYGDHWCFVFTGSSLELYLRGNRRPVDVLYDTNEFAGHLYPVCAYDSFEIPKESRHADRRPDSDS